MTSNNRMDLDSEKLDESYPTIVNNPQAPKPEMISPYFPILTGPVEADEIGRIASYRVLSLLGKGGMGMVFHAVDMNLGRPVALKVMRPEATSKEVSGDRFLREARAMAMIKHDNIVTIYQIGQERDVYFIAMELLLGETLEAHMERITQWKLAELLRISIELANGLSAMHENNLIHRDIKPANIWLEGPQLRVKILDFGLVRAAKDDVAITSTGVIMGTPAFMSPEQVRGKPADVRSDLYSFGCVLYRLCTGRLPHHADNNMAQLAAVVADEPTAVRMLNPAIPESLSVLVMQLLAKDPRVRPESARSVADRLVRIHGALASGGGKAPTAKIESVGSSAIHAEVLAKKPSVLERSSGKIVVFALAAAGLVAIFAIMLAGAIVLFDVPIRPREKGPPKAVGERALLVDLKPAEAVNWPFPQKKGPKKKDKDFEGKKELDVKNVVVNGMKMPNSIFMHPMPPHDAPASLSYNLDKKYHTFAGKVSQNDSAPGARSPMLFRIYADRVRIWESKGVSTNADAQDFAVPVKGVSVLKLEVVIEGNEIGGCHGVWLEPQLMK